ncbi:MAG: ribbon-helix-helix domain-containing protein [Propionibacteriaceae bacterium]|nr:ribbon-helix-helix domain-containing protein [Propionibacteriaceae bacterium]
MSQQIAVRLTEEELAILDTEVEAGRARNRSDAVRRSIAYLDRYRGYRHDAEIITRVMREEGSVYPDLPVMSVFSGLD